MDFSDDKRTMNNEQFGGREEQEEEEEEEEEEEGEAEGKGHDLLHLLK